MGDAELRCPDCDHPLERRPYGEPGYVCLNCTRVFTPDVQPIVGEGA